MRRNGILWCLVVIFMGIYLLGRVGVRFVPGEPEFTKKVAREFIGDIGNAEGFRTVFCDFCIEIIRGGSY